MTKAEFRTFIERRYWVDGLTLSQLGSELGVCAERVRQIMKRLGIKREVGRRSKQDATNPTRL